MLTLYQNNLSKGIKSGHFIISPTVNLCRNVRWIFWFYSVFFGYRFSSSFHSTGRWKTNFFGTHRLWLLTFWPFFSCLLFTKLCRGGDLQFFTEMARPPTSAPGLPLILRTAGSSNFIAWPRVQFRSTFFRSWGELNELLGCKKEDDRAGHHDHLPKSWSRLPHL